MKQNRLSTIFFFALFLLLNPSVFGQYLETFSTPNKGILVGACNFTVASCISDFSGVDWTINGDFSGMDSNDFMSTNGSGVLDVFGDIDGLMCFETPELNIGIGGPVSISLDFVWTSHDGTDYVDVEYKIDGGSWIAIANQFGGGSHTIDFATSGNSGSGTVTQTGLTGSTMSIRVCTQTNSSGDNTTIDNVSVPQAGVVVLPVELISFGAKKIEKTVVLNWSTATEINNDRFEIEHRTSEKSFKKIGTVSGNGTNLSSSDYTFNHERATAGLNYYRLKQIDFDGQFEYSNLVSVNIQPKEVQTSDLYPNPSKNGLINLDFFAFENSSMSVMIYDISGKEVFQQKVSVVEGQNKLLFNISDIEKGLYWIKVGEDVTAVYRKLAIQ